MATTCKLCNVPLSTAESRRGLCNACAIARQPGSTDPAHFLEEQFQGCDRSLIVASWTLAGLLVVGLLYFGVTAILGQKESITFISNFGLRLALFCVVSVPFLFLRGTGLR